MPLLVDSFKDSETPLAKCIERKLRNPGANFEDVEHSCLRETDPNYKGRPFQHETGPSVGMMYGTAEWHPPSKPSSATPKLQPDTPKPEPRQAPFQWAWLVVPLILLLLVAAVLYQSRRY